MWATTAIAVKMRKLVRKIAWNSLASGSVSPDRLLGLSVATGTPAVVQTAVRWPRALDTATGSAVMPGWSRPDCPRVTGRKHLDQGVQPMKAKGMAWTAMARASPKTDR